MWLKEVKRFGLLQFLRINGKVTLQDLGRRGWQHLGITESGAADEVAYLWANRLLGNHVGMNNVGHRPHCAALEITLGQCTLMFTAPTTVVVTGAPTPLWLNEASIPLWQTFVVKAGDILRLGLPTQGLLNYIAVAGGFLAPLVCDSRSICEREALGPNNGKPFILGNCIGFQSSPKQTLGQRLLSPAYIPPQYNLHEKNHTLELNCMVTANKALQLEAEQFIATAYRVSPQANRMAYRLAGKSITSSQTALASSGTALGMVQLPHNGEPIILLKDRQTMGGYPVLGCLTYLSCSVLAQCRPGQPITFKTIALATAQQATLAFYRGLGFLEP